MAGRARLLWLVPALLALHNAEEALTLRPVLPALRARLPEGLRAFAPEVTYPAFLVAVAVVTAAPLAVALAGDLRRARSRAGYALLAVQATVLVNVASHLAAAALLGGYAPGLATALGVNLPFSLFLFHVAWHGRWYGRRALAALAPLALLLHGPVLLGLLALAAWAT